MLGAIAMLSRRSPVLRQFRAVVNWGNSTPLQVGADVKVYNAPSYIVRASNKLTALQIMQRDGVRVPEFFDSKAAVPAERKDIYLARTALTGSCGVGIHVVRAEDVVPDAPLYVKYIKKLDELRLHVAFGKVIFLQYKKRQSEAEQTADQKLIRNHGNGWVFCPRPVEEAPADSAAQAVLAVQALGLEFGAVDIVVGKKDNMPYVLEVNTAPGIESPTLSTAYQQAFSQELDQYVRPLGR
jgi:glutathione synthase/RimK-type ligase-like ATP-grasp enzyme